MAQAGTKKRTNPVALVREVRQEGRKVTWTTWKETLVTSIMVFIMVVLAAGFFFLVDMTISTAVKFILALGA
jgi:preprotein translocase subunit SecE